MKTTIQINGKPVEIELTADQVKAVNLASLDIVDRLNSIQDAFDYCGEKIEDYVPFKNPKNSDQVSINAYGILIIIHRAYNEKREPNWDDPNERKYYAWWKISSGFGFSYYDWTYAHTGTYVGSRLCLLNGDHVEPAAKLFKSTFEEFLTYKKP